MGLNTTAQEPYYCHTTQEMWRKRKTKHQKYSLEICKEMLGLSFIQDGYCDYHTNPPVFKPYKKEGMADIFRGVLIIDDQHLL